MCVYYTVVGLHVDCCVLYQVIQVKQVFMGNVVNSVQITQAMTLCHEKIQSIEMKVEC